MSHKHLSFIVIFIVSALAAQGQVTQIEIYSARNSILRACVLPDGREMKLILAQEDPTTSYFIFHQDGETTAQRFPLPTTWTINDVRIWEGNHAYFCGIDRYTNKGLVGMFDIMALLGGTGPVYYQFFDWNSTFFSVVTDLKRMELFKTPGGVGMAMVGDALFDSILQQPTTTVAYADFNGTLWHTCTLMRKPSSLKFTDIACLDDLIVAVGSDTLGTGCYLKTFFSGSCFPSMQCLTGYYQQLIYSNSVGNVLASRTQENTAVLAHFDSTAGGKLVLHKVSFSGSTGFPSLPDTWASTCTAPAYNTSWQLRELTTRKDLVYLLHYTAYPNAFISNENWWLMGFSLPGTTPSIHANLWSPSRGTAQSLDNDVLSAKPRISCMNPQLLTYGTATWNTESCCIHDSVTLERGYGGFNNIQTDFGSAARDVPTYIMTAVLTGVPADIICSIKND